jgi:hypothetical protein
VNAGDAVIVSTGLSLSPDRPYGREAQSSAFFRTPDMPWLYSGEIMMTPSLVSITERRARTDWGDCS